MLPDEKISLRSWFGFIGLVYLGSRIARRLIGTGFPVVVYDLDHTKAVDTLVDVDLVRFLSASEEAAIALVRCPLCVYEAGDSLIATGPAPLHPQIPRFGSRGIYDSYTPELATDYSSLREKFDETDQDLFNALDAVGVEGKEVLDFGCGDGRYSLLLKEMGANHVTGLDLSHKMIHLAKTQAEGEPGVDFIVADGMHVPLNKESADLIVSNFVVHYFPDSERLFKELYRVLKTNGSVIGTFNVSDVDKGFEHLYNTNMPIRLGHGTESVVVHNLIKSRPEVHQAVRDAGFVTEQEKELHHPNATIDDSYCDKEHVHKHAVLLVLQKRKTATTNHESMPRAV